LYRKFTADHIFNGYDLLPGQTVLITDATGVIINMVDQKDSGDGVEVFEGLITPGFVNAHCHLELTYLRGVIPENTGLVEFVQQVMGKRGVSQELNLDAMREAEVEMYECGIVAVGDICNTTDSISVKQQSNLIWHNFIEVSGFIDAVAEKRLMDMKLVYDQFKPFNHKTTFSPHAPYSVSKKLFQLINNETANEIITIHNQECKAEDDLYKHKMGGFLKLYKNFAIDFAGFEATGKSSFQSWLPYFTRGQSIISVHNTFTSLDDVTFLLRQLQNVNSPFYYCLCINANKYIEQAIPPVDLLRKLNCNIIIGTDSYASNHQLNVLEEIKTIQQETDYSIPLVEILQWATINGATALRLQHNIGSFETGKKPGIVLIEKLNNLQTTSATTAMRIL